MTCGIYQITLPSGMVYIGSSKDIAARIHLHRADLKKGTHDNKWLRHERFNHASSEFLFSTLQTCAEEQLLDREDHHIRMAFASGSCANINRPGKSGFLLNSQRAKLRDRFEQEATTKNLDLQRNEFASYTSDETQIAWNYFRRNSKETT